MTFKYLAAITIVGMLTACGQSDSSDANGPVADPAVAQALNDPIMVDPDLSSRNEGAAAITIDSNNALPVLPPTPEAIAAARADAAEILGGVSMAVPKANDNAASLPDGASAADHLAIVPGGAMCAGRITSGAIWAARLPPELPVYPRGATMAAFGVDSGACHARVVRFVTPIPPAEVIAFYWTRTTQARFKPERRQTTDKTDVLTGRNGNAAFDLRVRDGRGRDALTQVELATVFGG